VSLRFGTDGIRGPASELTGALVTALGQAAASVLGAGPFVIGRDTRESGPRLEAALAAGLRSGGASVEPLGVVPTPVVAWVSATRDRPGAMISASHNAFADNGIKFFAAGGRKLSDALEAELEAALDEALATARSGPAPASSARAPADDAAARLSSSDLAGYRSAVASSIEGRTLSGLTVVIDCSNGAATTTAPEVLRSLGASVTVIHASPDGRNINDGCGSTSPGDLQAAVIEHRAEVGLAFDGDADRVVAVDEQGAVVDGDHLIAMCAIDRHARGQLRHDGVVVTVMTNLGFRLAMAERGIQVVETPVGDRAVLDALDQRGLVLGGEQSGHVIFRELATTGDGLLTGVQLLDLIVRSGRHLSALAADAMTRLPQVLRAVTVEADGAELVAAIAAEIDAVTADLGGWGRVLVRPSGTEPVVRVMVEAPDEAEATAAADHLVAALNRATARYEG
jgi:phosphoglucosamine mutase